MTPQQEFQLALLRSLRDRGEITDREYDERSRALLGDAIEAAPGEPLRGGSDATPPYVLEPAGEPPPAATPEDLPSAFAPESEPGTASARPVEYGEGAALEPSPPASQPPFPSVESAANAVETAREPQPGEPFAATPSAGVPALPPPPPPAWATPLEPAPPSAAPPPRPPATLSWSEPETKGAPSAPPPPPAGDATLAWEGPAPEPAIAPYERPPGDPDPYPVRFEVEYPESLSRVTTFFRLFLALPLLFLMYPLTVLTYAAQGLGYLTVFLRRSYPGWLFAAHAGVLGFQARTVAYLLLLTDRYPSFEPAGSPVRLMFARPPSGRLSRWRVFFWKGLLLLPNFFVLQILSLCAGVVSILAWFAILFTGRYPRGLFGFVTGVGRWHFRTTAYFASFNDRYPPYALSSSAGPASPATVRISAVLGVLLAGALATIIGAIAYLDSSNKTQEVDYSDLASGRANPATITSGPTTDPDFSVRLRRVYDPGDELARVIEPPTGSRLVVFEWLMTNTGFDDERLTPGFARLTYDVAGGGTRSLSAELVTAGDRVAPVAIGKETQVRVRAVFLVPRTGTPTKLVIDPPWDALGGIAYEFR